MPGKIKSVPCWFCDRQGCDKCHNTGLLTHEPEEKQKKERAYVPCPHLQWWETMAGQVKVRKCVTCPRVEIFDNGTWVRPKAPKKAEESVEK